MALQCMFQKKKKKSRKIILQKLLLVFHLSDQLILFIFKYRLKKKKFAQLKYLHTFIYIPFRYSELSCFRITVHRPPPLPLLSRIWEKQVFRLYLSGTFPCVVRFKKVSSLNHLYIIFGSQSPPPFFFPDTFAREKKTETFFLIKT